MIVVIKVEIATPLFGLYNRHYIGQRALFQHTAQRSNSPFTDDKPIHLISAVRTTYNVQRIAKIKSTTNTLISNNSDGKKQLVIKKFNQSQWKKSLYSENDQDSNSPNSDTDFRSPIKPIKIKNIPVENTFWIPPNRYAPLENSQTDEDQKVWINHNNKY